MDTTNRVAIAVNSALLMLLRPLCRLLLRYHVPFGAFEELAKHVYVQTALEDFALPGKKPSLSRASILTGLTRKDVQRLVAEPEPVRAASQEGFNRAARVLGGWARDADFHTAAGRPAALDPQEGPASFAELVRRYSGDMPARAMLDELLRVGAVQRRADGRIELVRRSYVPTGDDVEKLGFLGVDVADLIATIDHNLQHGATDPRYQRKVMYRSVPAEIRPAFRALSATRAQALLEQLDAWLAEHDTDNPPDQPDAPRVRLGLGIYYFEAPADEATPGKEN
ncbi:MAG: hypothetical protein Fur0014_02530 [Rubrivivax sp.]